MQSPAPAPRRRALRPLLLAALAALFLAPPLGAQQRPPPVELAGRVVDAGTGAPIASAVVRLPELYREAVTDSAGRFRLSRVPAGEHRVVVTRLGYADMRQALVAGGAPEEAEVALTPQPLVLERISVLEDVFTTRRKRAAYAVHVMDREELLRTRMYSARHLLPQLGADVLRCSGRGGACVWSRGRYIRPYVTIDDRPAMGGIYDLDMYAPQDLYVLEVMRGGAFINAYTVEYVERLARSGRDPWEVIL